MMTKMMEVMTLMMIMMMLGWRVAWQDFLYCSRVEEILVTSPGDDDDD